MDVPGCPQKLERFIVLETRKNTPRSKVYRYINPPNMPKPGKVYNNRNLAGS
jgi:hypothetical protein